MSSYTPAERRNLVGKRLALEALRRGSFRGNFTNETDPDLALFLGWVGIPADGAVRVITNGPTGGGHLPVPKKPPGGSAPGVTNPIEFPRLYTHTSDLILVERTRFAAVNECDDPNEDRRFAWFRTPWMSGGVAETQQWMTAVVASYNTYRNQNPQVGPVAVIDDEAYPSDLAAMPSRVVFDQELALMLHSAPVANRWQGCTGADPREMNADESFINWADCLDYWAALKTDSRFTNETTGPVPGHWSAIEVATLRWRSCGRPATPTSLRRH